MCHHLSSANTVKMSDGRAFNPKQMLSHWAIVIWHFHAEALWQWVKAASRLWTLQSGFCSVKVLHVECNHPTDSFPPVPTFSCLECFCITDVRRRLYGFLGNWWGAAGAWAGSDLMWILTLLLLLGRLIISMYTLDSKHRWSRYLKSYESLLHGRFLLSS